MRWMISMVDFKKVCDRCFHQLGDNENMYAFKVVDDLGQELIIKGHKSCIDEAVEIMSQLYGTKEKSENDNR
jgi:hypothetical protein